jgi:nucleotide-binding universal stress UspA family protein
MQTALKYVYHPTDFSDTALNALVAAADIANRTNAELVLLHSYEQPYFYGAMAGGVPALVDMDIEHQLRANLETELAKLGQHDLLKGLKVSTKLIPGLPVWRYYEDVPAKPGEAIVVMGTTGATGLLHGGWLGTNAERTIRYSPVPVLSIPAETLWPRQVHSILFVTDFSDDDRHPLLTLAPFAQLLGARIEVLTVCTAHSFYTHQYVKQAFEQLCTEFPNTEMHQVMVNAQSLQTGIVYAQNELNTQLLAMFTRGRTALGSLFERDSATEDVSAQIKLPLLALKPVV